MRTNLKAIGGVVASLALCAALVPAFAADDAASTPSPEQVAAAMAAAAAPGPEHAKLEPLVGHWTYTCKLWMDPSAPPVETTGTIDRRWILGKRFVEERVEGQNFDGTPGFEGLGLIGYDNAQKKYTSSWSCSMGTGTCTGLGATDAAGGLTFKTQAFCPLQKKTVNGREVLRFESNDKTVMESYMEENGKEVKMMELVAVRKK